MTTDAPHPRHAFDFWIGEWEVFGPEGARLGTSSIVAVLGTGALAEHWHGAGGFEGRSLNAYDATRGHWHQTWLDSTGGVLMLDGGPWTAPMVLEGLAPGEDPSAMLLQRITWTPGAGRRTPALGEQRRRRRDVDDRLRRPLPPTQLSPPAGHDTEKTRKESGRTDPRTVRSFRVFREEVRPAGCPLRGAHVRGPRHGHRGPEGETRHPLGHDADRP